MLFFKLKQNTNSLLRPWASYTWTNRLHKSHHLQLHFASVRLVSRCRFPTSFQQHVDNLKAKETTKSTSLTRVSSTSLPLELRTSPFNSASNHLHGLVRFGLHPIIAQAVQAGESRRASVCLYLVSVITHVTVSWCSTITVGKKAELSQWF